MKVNYNYLFWKTGCDKHLRVASLKVRGTALSLAKDSVSGCLDFKAIKFKSVMDDSGMGVIHRNLEWYFKAH